MDKRILWPVLVVLVIGLVAIFLPRRGTEPPATIVESPPVTSPEFTPFDEPLGDPEPPPDFVHEELPEPMPRLPALNDSDVEAREALAGAADEQLLENHVPADGLVRRLVVTVDNLPRDEIWIKARAIAPLDGAFIVEGREDEPVISEQNFARYTSFVRLIEAVNTETLATSYQRYYPLLQEAYEELGFPGRQFHNRALEVIDHLLQTPQVEGPIRLEQPHVLYNFADPELEALSSGQKALIRMGPQNAAALRAKLVELRAVLAGLSEATDAG